MIDKYQRQSCREWEGLCHFGQVPTDAMWWTDRSITFVAVMDGSADRWVTIGPAKQ